MLLKLTENKTGILILLNSDHIVFMEKLEDKCRVHTTCPERAMLTVSQSIEDITGKLRGHIKIDRQYSDKFI